MSGTRIIPVTPIMRRYQELRRMRQERRLAEARRLVAHPGYLAALFADSVADFTAYSNATDRFYPKRPDHVPADEIKRTNDLVLRLLAQKRISPVDAPGRLTAHDAGPSVIAVPADKLAMEYVDRELLLQRTTSPAKWDDGRHNRGGVRLDVLLADARDRTPVVGELKLPGDMDPFFALFQALACAAHLATPNQYERMRRHLPDGRFPELSGAPRLDVCVLFIDPPDYDPATLPKGRYMADLKTCAEMLAPKLLAQDALAATVRRITALAVRAGDDKTKVSAEVRWAWQRRA
jgi:hypothetical protein